MSPPALQLTLKRGAEQAPGVRLSVPVVSMRFLIGRDPACDWPIADRTLGLSARHCEIVQADGAWLLRDLSTNGTFVNGAATRLAAPHRLADGDRVALGVFQFEVRTTAAAALSPASGAASSPAARPAAARRGGDPAAMLAEDWEQAGAAESAAGIDADVRTGFTRIERPPRRTAAEAGAPAAGPASPTVPAALSTPAAPAGDTVNLSPEQAAGWRAAAAPAPSSDAPWLSDLARGLGIAPAALADIEPSLAAERLGELLRRLDAEAGAVGEGQVRSRTRAWLQGPPDIATLLAAALRTRGRDDGDASR